MRYNIEKDKIIINIYDNQGYIELSQGSSIVYALDQGLNLNVYFLLTLK